jgi:hypothetical protein
MSYFRSLYCLSELNLMRERERRFGCHTAKNARGLILPVIVHDGQHFPDYAKDIQFLDCRDYFIPGPGFQRTPKYLEFYERVREFSSSVASVIQEAPIWKEEFGSDELFRSSLEGVPPLRVSARLPRLE